MAVNPSGCSAVYCCVNRTDAIGSFFGAVRVACVRLVAPPSFKNDLVAYDWKVVFNRLIWAIQDFSWADARSVMPKSVKEAFEVPFNTRSPQLLKMSGLG